MREIMKIVNIIIYTPFSCNFINHVHTTVFKHPVNLVKNTHIANYYTCDRHFKTLQHVIKKCAE